MWKGTSFMLGITAGLFLMVLARSPETAAHAAPPQGVDNQGKFTVAVGGSEPNRYDMLWVLHEHPTHPSLRPDRGEDSKANQITLALYKIEKQGEMMKLIAARDIAYDIELQNWKQEDPDAVKVYELYKKRLAAAKNK